MSRPRIVHLGINGLGPGWDEIYRPALERLSGRVTVHALHHPLARVGWGIAQAIKANWCAGVRQLLQTQPMDGVVLSDADWYGLYPVAVAVDAGVAAYVTMTRPVVAGALSALHAPASTRGILVMPELRLRYMPATLRLRELIATELGPVQEITVTSRDAGLADVDWVETQLCDWCRVVIGRQPREVESRLVSVTGTKTGTDQQRQTELLFEETNGNPVRVTFRLSGPDSPGGSRGEAVTERSSRPSPAGLPADQWPLDFHLQCQNGEARISDAVHLHWCRGGQEHSESLSSDRTAVAVAMDLFARRLAGGLIPTPDLGDVLHALRIQQFAARSRNGEGRLSTK